MVNLTLCTLKTIDLISRSINGNVNDCRKVDLQLVLILIFFLEPEEVIANQVHTLMNELELPLLRRKITETDWIDEQSKIIGNLREFYILSPNSLDIDENFPEERSIELKILDGIFEYCMLIS